MLKKWKLLKKKIVFNQPHAVVEDWLFRLPNGNTKHFNMKGGKDFVMVVGITAQHHVVLIQQFYVNVEKKLRTLVAGYCDSGEQPAAAAGRELLEETGYRAKRLVSLGTSIKGKYTTGTVHHFLALGVKRIAKQQLEEAEDITVTTMSLAAFKKLIVHHKIADVFAETCARRALDYIDYHGI